MHVFAYMLLLILASILYFDTGIPSLAPLPGLSPLQALTAVGVAPPGRAPPCELL